MNNIPEYRDLDRLMSLVMSNNFTRFKTDPQDRMDKHDSNRVPLGDGESSMEEVFLIKLKDAIDKNLETPDFGVDELGREIGMSRSQVHRKLQSLTGVAPSKYIRTRRLQKARDLLQRKIGTVSEISDRFGFSSPAYFSQVYVEEFGYPPSQEQKQVAPIKHEILNDEKHGGQRKLAAIMFTDVSGYTALMGKDEAKAMEILRQNRAIQRPLIEENNGKLLKEMGDGILAQFDSAYDSVLCALKIQRRAMMGFEGKIRIGIHLGDVTIDKGDVFGDGVNIASRLENIADPGGVYITESIQKALRGRGEFKTQFLGEVQLKNVDYLVSTYCLVDDGLPVPSEFKIRQLRAKAFVESGAPLSNINHDLIQEVFNALVKAKPSVRKYLEAMDEDDEGPDVRELADLIIRNYPWVIGVELRRLFSGSLRTLNRERLEQLLFSIHRSLQFLGFVLIIELYEKVCRKEITLSKEFQQELKSRFVELSTADFIWVIREVNNLLKSNSCERYIPEIAEYLDEEFYDQLDFEMPKRGSLGEYALDFSESEMASQCLEYQNRLKCILTKLTFITQYKLVTIKEIKVLKNRHQEALFEHWMDILSSANSEFSSKEEKFETYADSNAVLLMKSLKKPQDFLNLSPLIIDTRGEAIDSREKFSLKKDIFICAGFANNNIRYVGTEISEECDLKGLNNYQYLVTEFRSIMNMDNEILKPSK